MKLGEQTLMEMTFEREELITEREAMIADNAIGLTSETVLRYGYDDFMVIQQKMKTLRERLIHISEAPEPEPYGVRPVL